MKNIAIILAAGTGSRMGSPVPKQFLDLDGSTVLEHSVEAFASHPAIDEVAVVVHPDWMEHARRLFPDLRLVEGGSERYLSTLNAVAAYLDCPDDTNLIFHDAARPWISQEVISRVVQALERHEAVGVGIPSTDTVWEVRRTLPLSPLAKGEYPKGEGVITRIPERKHMWRAQTPQAFRLWVIRDAYQRALQDPQFTATDDCGVVRKYMPEMKIHVVEGDERNRKITFPEDLPFSS